MSKRSKACAIPPEVKEAVWYRDRGECVLCKKRVGPQYASAHFISRAQGGLGVEQNVLTLCWDCHMKYDQSTEHEEIEKKLEKYLRDKYPGWNRSDLIFDKWRCFK